MSAKRITIEEAAKRWPGGHKADVIVVPLGCDCSSCGVCSNPPGSIWIVWDGYEVDLDYTVLCHNCARLYVPGLPEEIEVEHHRKKICKDVLVRTNTLYRPCQNLAGT